VLEFDNISSYPLLVVPPGGQVHQLAPGQSVDAPGTSTVGLDEVSYYTVSLITHALTDVEQMVFEKIAPPVKVGEQVSSCASDVTGVIHQLSNGNVSDAWRQTLDSVPACTQLAVTVVSATRDDGETTGSVLDLFASALRGAAPVLERLVAAG
jgi:hypothetical protein